MITNTEIRNALTGALVVMAMGLFTSCSDTLVAPMDEGPVIHAPSADTTEESLQSCTLVDGVWVCTSTNDPGATTSGSGLLPCRMIDGVLHCPPEGMG